MLKIFRDAPPVKNVIAGQNATLDLDLGYNYHCIRLIATVTKDNATALEPTLDEAIGQIVLNVNKDPKRTHLLASHLNSIQKSWNSDLTATLYSKIGNDLKTATVDGSANGRVQRTSTWVLDVWLSEPSRSTYTARQAFSWPTAWANKAIGAFPANYTANIQAVIGTPAAGTTLTAPVMRAEIMWDAGWSSCRRCRRSLAWRHRCGPSRASRHSGAGAWHSDDARLALVQLWKTYGGTAVQLRGTEWPFNSGSLQQLSMFCQSGDDITDVVVYLDTAVRLKTTKNSINQMNEAWGWNSGYGAGTAGIDYVFADVLHMAFDFDDDPSSAVSTATFNTLELDLTLNQAVAANKSINMAAQFYRNALLL